MTDRIYVTYTPTTVPWSYHATIHYQRIDPAGNVVRHVTIEAKPEKLDELSALDKADGVIKELSRTDAGPSRFGRIDAHVNDQKPGDVPNAPYEIIAEGDDLSANLRRMQLFARAVNVAGFAYRGDRQNSNTFAGGTLRAGELPPATGVAHDPTGPAGELLEFFAPGLNEPLSAPIGPRREAGEVARRWFDNRFGEWDSVPAGAVLPSAAGDPDSFNGRFGNWGFAPVGDPSGIRSPVLRALEKYRRSAGSIDGPVSASAWGALPATPAFQPDIVGRGGVLGKFKEARLATPAAAESSLSPLPGSAAEETDFGYQSENASVPPWPDTYPRLRRVSPALPGLTPPDPEPPERAPLPGIFSGKPMSLLPPSAWGLPDNSNPFGKNDWINLLAGPAFQKSTQPEPRAQTASLAAARFAPSDDANFSGGGLLGRLLGPTGNDPQNPNRPALPPMDDQREQADVRALEAKLLSSGHINGAVALYNARKFIRRRDADWPES